jgi:capsid protein
VVPQVPAILPLHLLTTAPDDYHALYTIALLTGDVGIGQHQGFLHHGAALVRIDLDRNGAASHYKILERGGRASILRASQVVHSMVMEHGDEVRQVSALAGAILNIQDSMELLSMEKTNVKDNQQASRVIKKEYAGAEDEFDDADPLGASSAPAAAGVEPVPLQAMFGPEVIRLGMGESLQSFKSERPNPTFTGFLNYLGREINAATGWRFEFSWSPESINSGNMRQVLDSCRRTAQLWQAEEIKATHRIRNYAIARAIELGELPAADRWWRAEYIPSAPDPTLDKGREGKLDVLLVKNRMLSLKEYFARCGKHWEGQLDQMRTEADYMERHGLNFASDTGESDVSGADIQTGRQEED